MSRNALLEQTLARAQALIEEGRLPEALDLLEENLPRFDRSPKYHAVMASTAMALGDFHTAAVHARAALDRQPADAELQMLATIVYLGAGYLSIAHRTRTAWLRTAQSDHAAYAMMRELEEEYRLGQEELVTDYGASNLKQAENAGYALDEGQWAADEGRWAEAARHARQATTLVPRWPLPRNNLSLALFMLGRPVEAAREVEFVLSECEPDNVHALTNGVRLSIALGNRAQAEAYGDRLEALPITDNLESEIKRLEGLGLLDRDAAIDRFCRRLDRDFKDASGALYLYWGIAAASLGQRRQAISRLERAIELGESNLIVDDSLNALRAKKPGRGIATRYSYTHYSDWIPLDAFAELTEIIKRDFRDAHSEARAWKDFLTRFPMAPLAVQKMLYEEQAGRDERQAFLDVLRRMATPESLEMLRAFALGQEGDTPDRMQALYLLQEAGVYAPGETVELWVDGKPQTIKLITAEISSTGEPDYPEAALEALDEGVTHYGNGRPELAERSYLRALELAPNMKEALVNLALIYDARDDTTRADAFVSQALAVDPNYVPALSVQVHRLLARNEIEAARDVLRPLTETPHWEPYNFKAYQVVLARIALAEEHVSDALKYLRSASEIDPTDVGISNMIAQLELAEMFDLSGSRFAEMDERYRTRRQRAPLAADPTLADCFGLLTKGDMVGVARATVIRSVTGMRKQALYDYMVQVYANPVFLAGLVGQLNPAERAALQDVLDHGGVMDWQAFAAVHGHDLEESPYMEYWSTAWSTVMGRLRARALLFEGTADGALIVAVPRELRAPLAALLAG